MLLVPPIPEPYVYEARLDPRADALFSGLEALGRHQFFMLAGIAERHAGGRRAAYVHAKMMLVDDVGPRSDRAICTSFPWQGIRR